MDYADARRRMVDGQLRPTRCGAAPLGRDARAAPRALPAAALRARAYLDEDVPLPGGRALMEPMVLGAAGAAPRAAARRAAALVVGAGTGYGAAVLARMGAAVTAVEEDAGARRHRPRRPSPPSCRPAGGPHGGPPPLRREAFDAVLVEGEVPAVPDSVSGLLAEGGRLATVVGGGRRNGVAVLGRRLGGAFTVSPVFDCGVTPLPAFAEPGRFVF
jgi:protein-L-isoaspartate(D-aspartate) O-methyltransferase